VSYSSASPALKWFILPLLALSLGWKLAVRPGDSPPTIERDVQLEVARFLARQHFIVTTSEEIQEGQPDIRATAGVCRILIAQSPVMGSDRDLLRRWVTADDHIFTVFRGKVYPEQPTWLTVPWSLWARFRRQLGLQVPSASVLTVIATATCDAERLPWELLS
jgi:hypothetical protein